MLEINQIVFEFNESFRPHMSNFINEIEPIKDLVS